MDSRVSHTKFHQAFEKDGMCYSNKVTLGYGSEKYVAGFQRVVGSIWRIVQASLRKQY